MLILLLLLPLRRCRSSDKSSRWIVEDSSSSDSGIVAIAVALLVVEVMVLATLVDMPLCWISFESRITAIDFLTYICLTDNKIYNQDVNLKNFKMNGCE